MGDLLAHIGEPAEHPMPDQGNDEEAAGDPGEAVSQLQRVRDLLAQHNLTAVSMSGHTDLASEQGADDFRNVFRLCKALGITIDKPRDKNGRGASAS